MCNYSKYLKTMICLCIFSQSTRAGQIPENIRFHLTNVAENPEAEIKRVQEIEEYLTKESKNVGKIIAQLGPESALAEALAAFAAHKSKPRDYLIIVTQFLNEVADGNFEVEKDKWIVYSLLGSDNEDAAGLIAMNYQIPELNEALRRAATKLSTDDQEWIAGVLSGEQRKETIEFCSGQGFPLPVTYSSLYPKGKTATSPGQTLKGLPEADVHGSQTSSPSKDTAGGRAKAKPFWWIFASVGAVVAFFLLAKRKKKSHAP